VIKKRFGWLIVIWILIIPSPLMAGPVIRVAVFIDVPSVSIAGSGPITLVSSSGEKVDRQRGPVQIVPGASGLILNGRKTGVSELLIRTQAPPLIVNGSTFIGSLIIAQTQGGLTGINKIDVEDYLRGVVPVEISPKWHPEALKVQAIAARTYALYQRQANGEKEYDLVATIADQVYTGLSQTHPAADKAIAETKGLVLTYHGHLILSMYHSTAAGQTEDGQAVLGIDLPYLKGVNCPFDRYSPRYRWTREIGLSEIEQAFIRSGYPLGTVSTLTPFDWVPSGRVSRLRVLHSEGEIILRGEKLRKILGYTELPSTHFTIEEIGQSVKFRGKGSGHGVGLCQWGAKEMAELGYSFDQILRYFYPGVETVSYSELE
jgi:stage II sporulation protein D